MYRIVIQTHSANKVFIPSPAKLKQWAKAALRHKVRRGELTIRLVEKEEMKALNKAYRHKNKPTNVLSFPAELSSVVKLKVPPLGDIVICSAIVNEEAEKQNKTYLAHWAHMVIHGALHILGYDHVSESDALRMEAKEIKLLHALGFNNPYILKEKEVS